MWALALCLLLFVQDTDQEKLVKAIADQLLATLDAGDYGKTYDAFSDSTKKVVPRDGFIEETGNIRKLLGKPKTRKFKSIEFATDPPGPPPGEYSAVQYQTSYENRDVSEAIALRMEDGKWAIIGYYLQ